MIAKELLDILVCPETRQPLHLASSSDLDRINNAIGQRKLSSRAGGVIEDGLTEALIRADELVAYPVREGIPIMLVEESFPMPSSAA